MYTVLSSCNKARSDSALWIIINDIFTYPSRVVRLAVIFARYINDLSSWMRFTCLQLDRNKTVAMDELHPEINIDFMLSHRQQLVEL